MRGILPPDLPEIFFQCANFEGHFSPILKGRKTPFAGQLRRLLTFLEAEESGEGEPINLRTGKTAPSSFRGEDFRPEKVWKHPEWPTGEAFRREFSISA